MRPHSPRLSATSLGHRLRAPSSTSGVQVAQPNCACTHALGFAGVLSSNKIPQPPFPMTFQSVSVLLLITSVTRQAPPGPAQAFRHACIGHMNAIQPAANGQRMSKRTCMCVAEALPISPLLPRVVECLASTSNLVLEAPPGAGKTTAVPLAILQSCASWCDGLIIVLEPRCVVEGPEPEELYFCSDSRTFPRC